MAKRSTSRTKRTKGWLSAKWLERIKRRKPMVKCTYCPFEGANHYKNFATKLNPRFRNYKPVCHTCAAKRREARVERKMLELRLNMQERYRRERIRAAKHLHLRGRRKVDNRDAVTSVRIAAIAARVRKMRQHELGREAIR